MNGFGRIKSLLFAGLFVLNACTPSSPNAPNEELMTGDKYVLELYDSWLEQNGFQLSPLHKFEANIGIMIELFSRHAFSDEQKKALENLINYSYGEIGNFMANRGFQVPLVAEKPFAERTLRVVVLENDNCINRVNHPTSGSVPYSIIPAEGYYDCGTNASSLTPIDAQGKIYPTSLIIVGNLPKSDQCNDNRSLLCTGDPRECDCLTDGQLLVASLAHEIAEHYLNLVFGRSDEGGAVEMAVTAFERHILYSFEEGGVQVLDSIYQN